MKTYKIMIIDDDVFFRKFFKKIINKHFQCIDTCIEAINGKDALDKLGRHTVDIVFSDVNMPQMTGIEFIKQVKQMQNLPVIVVLSAYDDFNYVREVLKQGAVDYLLKHELKEDDVRQVVENCLDKVGRVQQMKRVEQSIQLEDHFRRFMRNMTDLTRQEDFISFFRTIERQEGVLTYVLVYQRGSAREVVRIYRRLREEYKDTQSFYFEKNKGEHVYFLYKKDEGNREKNRFFLDTFLGNYHELFEKGYVGISCWDNNIEHIVDKRMEAEEASFQGMIRGRKSIRYEDIVWSEFEESKLEHILTTIEGQLGRVEIDLLDYIEGVYRLFGEKYYNKIIWEKLNYKIIRQLVKYADKKGINLEEDFIRKGEEIVLVGTGHEMIIWITELLKKVSEGTKAKNYTELTLQCMVYIEMHLTEAITVPNLAEVLKYSESYISKQFKQDTGMRLKEYINIAKIEYAKLLFKSGKYKVYEVADILGFSSDAYFCMVFKTIEGMTVKEYLTKNND